MADAARELGDLDAFAQELARRRIVAPVRRVKVDPPVVAAVAIRRMTRDEVALIDLRIERLLETRLEASAEGLRAQTRRFPGSAAVWFEYAAAEYARVQHSDFGGRPVFRGFGFSNGELIVMANPYSDAEAWRAVNAALAIDPAHAPARRLKAEIMLARLVRAGNPALSRRGQKGEARGLLVSMLNDPAFEAAAWRALEVTQ